MTTAELIKDFNVNKGETPQAPEAAQPQTEQPPAQNTPPAQQQNTVPNTEQAPPQAKNTEKYSPPDPSFVKGGSPEEPQSAQTPEALAAAQAQVDATAGDVISDEKIYSRLSEMTEGSIRSEQDLVGIINLYNELLEEKQAGFEPKFQSEQAKYAYDLLKNVEAGKELETAQRTIRALSFSFDKKSEKDIMLAGFMADPDNSDLSESMAAEIFEKLYNEKYTDLENDILQKRQHAQEAKKARESISKVQDEFKKAQAGPAEGQQQVEFRKQAEGFIGKAVENFGGVRMAFSDNPSEGDYLNIEVTDPREIAQLRDNALYPDKWYKGIVEEFINPVDGKLDWNGLINKRWMMENVDKVAKLAYEHGQRSQKVESLNKSRNASTVKDIANIGSKGAPVVPEKSFAETWKEAAAAKKKG